MAVHGDNYWLEQIAGLTANVVVSTDVPASATATGKPGQIAYDTSYLYVCVATDTWRRVAIAAW